MARPLTEGLDFFSIKTKPGNLEAALIRKFGNIGFSVYYRTLRLIAESLDGELDCTNKLLLEDIAELLGVKLKEWENIIEYSANIGLFHADNWRTTRTLISTDISEQRERIQQDRLSARLRKWRAANPGSDDSQYYSANNLEPPPKRKGEKGNMNKRETESKTESASGKRIGDVVGQLGITN